jgi:hypothetical protein
VAAVLFGVGAPVGRVLAAHADPLVLADLPVPALVVLSGGVVAPALLLLGLGRVSAVTGSLVVLGERFGARELGVSATMIAGVWLVLGERHAHWHAHEPITHDHRHVHDEHHRHAHHPGDPPGEPHAHEHRHEALAHDHQHVSDLHHRHH